MKVINKIYKFRIYPNKEQKILLAKHIADVSWGNFITLLQYKCDWYGKELIKVNHFYPSSKTCNNCGQINQELKLSDREWTYKCGKTHNRDLNASKNILKEGLKIYGKRLAITKAERKSDFSDKAHSMKPETHKSLANV